jgi:hypothetical protein
VVVLGWIGVSVYALVKLIGSAPEDPSPVAVVLFFVLLVTTLVTAFMASIALIGRSMTPRKRRKDAGAAQLAFELPAEDESA